MKHSSPWTPRAGSQIGTTRPRSLSDGRAWKQLGGSWRRRLFPRSTVKHTREVFNTFWQRVRARSWTNDLRSQRCAGMVTSFLLNSRSLPSAWDRLTYNSFLHDITARKQVEETLARQKVELVRTNV